ncbi:hypothetical protein QYE76_056789 [Lolium multiflorum]|uniref:CCHC-type domain-containing protein n=1 Tax=Lolium multiflorum TaxID=4521 RepID=A0AAD8T370_LOLMU|nr:hypothetical protein QYE76_056789 [Lolium multiflorum]
MIGSLFSAQSSSMPPQGASGLQMQPYAAASDAATSSAPAITASTSSAPAVAASTSSAPAPVSFVVAVTPAPPAPSPALDITTAFPPPYHFGNHITLKLTPDNYIFWRAHVLPLLRSHYLLGYVDGTLLCPPALVDGVHSPGSLSLGVAGLVVFAKTSHEAWTILATMFSAQSQARANVLRRQLGESQKLDKTVTDYYNQVRAIADTLASIGQPITDADFTSYTINDLDEEYDGLVEVVNERANTSPMPPHELYQRLLQTEQRVEARPGRREASGHLGDSAAHVANRGGSRPPPSVPYSPSGKTAPPPPAPDHSGGGRSKRVCQLCGQEGHVAAKCHRRFQRSFLGLGNDGKDTRNNARQAAMADRPVPPPSQGQTQTYVDPHWYMDTGSTDHLTSELGKLHTRDVYIGSDKVHTANGAGTGCGVRLELFDDATPSSPLPNVDRVTSHGLDKRDHARSASNVDHCKPTTNPMSSTDKITAADGELFSSADATEYRSIVGGLQCLTITRPDISYDVNRVSQYLHEPRDTHWSAVKRILRYVSLTVSYGLHIRPNPSGVLSAYSDADWAGSSNVT